MAPKPRTLLSNYPSLIFASDYALTSMYTVCMYSGLWHDRHAGPLTYGLSPITDTQTSIHACAYKKEIPSSRKTVNGTAWQAFWSATFTWNPAPFLLSFYLPISPCVFLSKPLWPLLFPTFGSSSKHPIISFVQCQEAFPLHLLKSPTLPGKDPPHFDRTSWELLPLIHPVGLTSNPGGSWLQCDTPNPLIRFLGFSHLPLFFCMFGFSFFFFCGFGVLGFFVHVYKSLIT